MCALLTSGVQASYSPHVSPASPPAKGTRLPGFGPQVWGSQYVAQTNRSPGMISVCVIPLLF